MGVCFVTGLVPMSLQLDVFVEFAINKVIYIVRFLLRYLNIRLFFVLLLVVYGWC